MIRASMGDYAYWNKWVIWYSNRILEMENRLNEPFGDPTYKPQYIFEIAKNYWELILLCYSRGDAVRELASHFESLLSAWKESNRLHLEFRTEAELRERRDWRHNLDHYIVCFWLVGLALLLDIPDAQWEQLLELIGNEGRDELLDRVIATRSPARKIGTTSCHPKPYARLLKAIDAPSDKQPILLKEFVDHWYAELDRPSTPGRPAMYNRPYWYTYGNVKLEDSGYFGRWCVEAAVVAKMFHIDDSLCLGHEHYPGDLLRPDGPSTHRAQMVSEPSGAKRWVSKLFRILVAQRQQ